MTTHTPGPWTVDKRYPVVYSVRNVGNAEVARLELTSLYAYDEPQRDANAALIAAAPDLLAALDACVNEATMMGCMSMSSDAYLTARDVLMKAKGETA